MQSNPTSLAAPPRHVPLSLRILNFFNAPAQFGWIFFGFGMIFFWAFALNGDYSFINFRGPLASGKGRVTSVVDTSASENKSRVRASHYEYSVAGKTLSGTSYSTGAAPAEGDEVTVEYSPDNPGRSRIAGMRRAMFGPGVSIVSLFPFIGLVVLVPTTLLGIKRNRLLREGMLAMGTLTNKEPTNMTVNKRPVYKLTFDFAARDGRRYEAIARTSLTERLEDEAQEPLLYDPSNPAKAYLLDEAPARPQFEMNGELRGRPAAALASLVFPVLVIGGHGLVVLFKLGVL